jgi:hypothetical protein
MKRLELNVPASGMTAEELDGLRARLLGLGGTTVVVVNGRVILRLGA